MTPTVISDISELGGWGGVIFRQTAAKSADKGSRMLQKDTDKMIDRCLRLVTKQDVTSSMTFQTFPHKAVRWVLCNIQEVDAVTLHSQWGRCNASLTSY